MDREVLLQCQVGVEEVRTPIAVPTCRADLIQARRCEVQEGLLVSSDRRGSTGERQPVVIRRIEFLNVQLQVSRIAIWVARCAAWDEAGCIPDS